MVEKKIINGILHAVIAVIFDEENQILMFLRRGEEWEQGWEVVKGAVHINESEEEAVLREIKEEAGLTEIKIIGKIPKVFWAEKPWKNGKLKIKSSIFVCKYIAGKIKLGEKEHIAWKWMSVEEAKEKLWIKGGDKLLSKAYELLENP